MKTSGLVMAIGLVCMICISTIGAVDYHWENSSSGDWNILTYWSPEGVPDEFDTATIAISSGSYTVTVPAGYPVNVRSITVNADDSVYDIVFNPRETTITTSEPSSILDGVVDLYNSIWEGPGALANYSDLIVHNSCSINCPFFQHGTVLVEGDLVSSTLTVDQAFTNHGDIILNSIEEQQIVLSITNGILTNAGDGAINVETGSGGLRGLTGNLTNNGIVNINTDTTYGGGEYINNGTFWIAPGAEFFSSGQNLSLDAGTVTIEGDLRVSASMLSFNGGTLSGSPVLIQSELVIGSGNTQPGFFIFHEGANILTGDLDAEQSILIQSGEDFAADVTSPDGFTNAGVVTLDSLAALASQIDVSNGMLTNAPGGLIQTLAGGGGSRTIAAGITNNGTLEINNDTTISKAAAVHTNNQTITIAPGTTLDFEYSDQTFNQDGGTLTVNGGFEMALSTFNFNGGSVIGTPVLNASDLEIAPGNSNPASFSFRGNGCQFTGDLESGQSIFVEGESAGTTVTAGSGFSNHGVINLDSIENGPATLSINNGSLNNASSGVINSYPGSGGDRILGLELHNNGTVNIETTTGLFLADANHTNSGTIFIKDQFEVFYNGFTNSPAGTITGNGTLLLSYTSLTNDGTVKPGLSAGILTFGGPYVQSSQGVIEIELGGYESGSEFDLLDITDQATLDGTLDIVLIESFLPGVGDTFDVVTATSGITDNGIELHADDQPYWQINWIDSTVLQVECIAIPDPSTPTPVPCLHHGDVDFSGGHTAQDAQWAFFILMGTLIPTYEQECAADCNGDGMVTAGDAQTIFGLVFGVGACADPL